ncbi:MAG TPA: leucyl/phenylalanyl-tRNA--protein transferase [Armatimonadaceae bacterium]|nr:leucyl/phenylalanyl-tRNA--protein transferase [Armatimonadaceae bacterium]
MPVLAFPDPRHSTREGIIAIGGDLHPDTLRLAYSKGIFPWPHEGLPLLWFCPPQRALLDFANLHVPERLARAYRNCGYTFTIDRAFSRVIRHCESAPRPGQEGTWITAEIVDAYCRLHQLGVAHSVEAWDSGGDLVGGLYGVDSGGVFAGESMFYKRPNASKFALLFLIDHLRARGADWLDIQMMTPHFQALGATEVPRAEFLKRLKETQAKGLGLFDAPTAP